MDFLKRLFAREQQMPAAKKPHGLGVTPAASRQPKPLRVNLGEVESWSLETIVRSGVPTAVVVQDAGDAIVTPEMARQALEAKKHEGNADSLAKSRRFGEAVEEYRRAIQIAPYEDEILWMSLGGALAEAGDFKAAIQSYEVALEINPRNSRVSRNLALVKAQAGVR
jgi:Flp pilus assembly protein TadD